MTNHDNHHETDSLPPELASLANDLNRLAAEDAASADGSLADRIFMKTRSAVLHEGMTPAVRKVNDDMAAVGAHERRSADAGLEGRVFDATVHHLRGSESSPVLAKIGTRRWVGRFAVAAGLAIAASGAWLVLSTPTTPGTNSENVAVQNPGGINNPTNVTTNLTTPSPVAVGTEPVRASSSELELVLASSEAEDSFVALFAIGDDLRSDIKAVATEAERVERALVGEQSTGG